MDSSSKKLHSCSFENCNKAFKQAAHLKRHFKTHFEKRLYICPVENCGKKFLRNKYLKQHSLLHTGEKKFQCHICSYKSFRKFHLTSHYASKHKGYTMPTSDNKKLKCSCPNCQFADAKGEKVVDSDGVKLHNCHYENCGKFFKKISQLASHLIIHTGERPHECKWQGCEKNFRSISHLKAHMLSHTGEQNCGCDTCGRRFYNKSLLIRHFITHSADKFSHLCKVEGCGKKFTRDHNLKLHHIRAHTGQFTYSCKWHGCDKKFTRKSTLKMHMATHNKNQIKHVKAHDKNRSYKTVKKSIESKKSLPNKIVNINETKSKNFDIILADFQVQHIKKELFEEELQQQEILENQQINLQLQHLDQWRAMNLQEPSFSACEEIDIEEHDIKLEIKQEPSLE